MEFTEFGGSTVREYFLEWEKVPEFGKILLTYANRRWENK
jgi:hypothetical protein